MKKKLLFSSIGVILVIALVITIIKWPDKKNTDCPYEEFITIDVFDSLANFQGIQGGWFGKIVKEKFNMELNIIAPNVTGGGETIFESKLLAGDIGDLMVWGKSSAQYYEMISQGLLMDMTDLLKDKDLMRYRSQIEMVNDGNFVEGKIYAVPTYLSSTPPDTILNVSEPDYGPYLRWDLYSKLGYPQISTIEDLLPILKDMQTLEPHSETGEPTYAFSFFNDWDETLMNECKHIANMYGYDAVGFVLAKGDGSDYQDIMQKDSQYMRALRFYFEANQMGLMDPNSPYQTYTQTYAKYQSGDILYCNLSWIANPAYNTQTHMDAGKAFMMAPIDDINIYCYGTIPSIRVIGIGKNAKDPERMADFIDWLYSPEGVSLMYTKSNMTAGPKGLTWDINESGPYLTDFGKYLFSSDDADIPAEWGGGTWSEGICKLNIVPVINKELDSNGYPYAFALWDSVLSMDISDIEADWRSHMNADYSLDYLVKNNKAVISSAYSFNDIPDSNDLYNKRAYCGKYIKDYSWKMIFAKDEAEFNDMYKELISYLDTLGYDEVVAFDLEKAKINQVEEKNYLDNYYSGKN